MLIRPKIWCVVAGAVFFGLSATGCAQIVPRLGATETDPTTDPALIAVSPTVTVSLDSTSDATKPQTTGGAQLGPQNVAVRKGAIDQQMSLTGRVSGAE